MLYQIQLVAAILMALASVFLAKQRLNSLYNTKITNLTRTTSISYSGLVSQAEF